MSTDPALPWTDSPIALGYGRAVSYLAPASATAGTSIFVVLFILASVWTIFVCACACFIATSFLLEWPQNGLLLRTFRWAGSLTASVLFLPLSGLLFRGLACENGDWLSTGLSCDAPARIITSVAAIIFVIILSGKFNVV